MSDAVDRAKAASTLLALDALYDAARDAAAHTAPPDAAAAADAAAADDDKDDERTAYFQARALLLLQACDKHTSAASGRCRGSEYYTARQRLLLAKYGKVAGVDELLQAQERLLSPKNDDGAKPRGEEEQQQHAAQEEGASQGAEESQGGTTASEAILLAHSTPDDSSEGHSPRTSRSRKRTNNAELFAFAGMHHIFAEQRSAVNVLCFANETKDLLAFGCADNTISVCTVVSRPAVVATLKGHVGQVTDLDWSIGNDFLLSASHDRTARLWQARGGLCARVFNLAQAPWCCRFHPLNNNLFAVGAQSEKGNKGCITVLNTSTGRPVDSFVTHGAVRSLCFDSRGDHLFAGDDKGVVYVHRVHANGALKLLCRNLIGAMPWSLQYKAWFRAGSTRCEPLLLASCKDCSAKVFRVEGLVPPSSAGAAATPGGGASSPSSHGARPGSLTLMYTVPVPCATHVVRAKFCPLLATRDSACIVTGGEDTTVTIHAMFATPTGPAAAAAAAASDAAPAAPAAPLEPPVPRATASAPSTPAKGKFKAPKRKHGVPSPAAARPSCLVPLWPSHSNPINRLQGHRDTVTDVSWSYDESLLASCDASGIVIVWKRVRNVSIS